MAIDESLAYADLGYAWRRSSLRRRCCQAMVKSNGQNGDEASDHNPSEMSSSLMDWPTPR